MAVTLVNLTGTLTDLVGANFDSRRTKVWIETNVEGDVVIDSAGNEIHLGNAAATVGIDGAFTFTDLVATNSTTNPTAFQYQVHIAYPVSLPQLANGGKNATWDSGWFSITVTSDLADIAAEQYVPPTWMTTATTTLQGYVDEGKAYRDNQALIAGLTGEDTAVAALVNQAGPTPAESATHAALSTSIAAQADTRGGIVVLASGYGMVGDNATDNLAAMTQAISDIKAAGVFAKAATLKLDRGTYLVSGLLPTLDAANLCIRGEGRDATTIKVTAAVAGSLGSLGITASGCRLESLTIDSNHMTNFAIKVEATAPKAHLHDVGAVNGNTHGIYLNGPSDVRLSNVRMAGNGPTDFHGSGIYASSADGLVLSGCISEDNYEHGYYLAGGATGGLVMTGCIARGNGGTGISARYSRMVITGNYSWSNGTGAINTFFPDDGTTRGSRAAVVGNVGGGSTGTVLNEMVFQGIENLVASGNYCETAKASMAVMNFLNTAVVTCSNNQVVSTGTVSLPNTGLKFDQVAGFAAIGNTVVGASTGGGNGIYLTNSSSGLVATNRVTGWNTGITIAANAQDNLHVLNNTLTGNAFRMSNTTSTGTGCIDSGNTRDAGYWEVGQLLALKGYTIAGLPAANGASAGAGTVGFVTDEGSGRPAWSNGSATWRYAADRIVGSSVIDFASIAAGTTVDSAAFTVAGARIGDAVILSTSNGAGAASPLESGLMGSAFVSGTNSVKVRLANVTVAAIDPVSRTYHVTVIR